MIKFLSCIIVNREAYSILTTISGYNRYKNNIIIKIMKKTILIILAILLLIGGVYLGYTLTKENASEEQEEKPIGIPNPASVYCTDNGGVLEIKKEVDGERGYCFFEDGSNCEEWAYFRGECKKGENFQ